MFMGKDAESLLRARVYIYMLSENGLSNVAIYSYVRDPGD